MFKKMVGTGPDPSTVVKLRQSRAYLDPRQIEQRGLDGWSLVRITGYHVEGDELRIFFQPDKGDWKSAVERSTNQWKQVLNAMGVRSFDQLTDKMMWVKLYMHQSKTDFAEIAPYQREDRHVGG